MPRYEITDQIIKYGTATYIVCADSEEEAIRKHWDGESEFEGSSLSGDWETTDIADEIEEIDCTSGCTECDDEDDEDEEDLGNCATCEHWNTEDRECKHPKCNEDWCVPSDCCVYFDPAEDNEEEDEDDLPPASQQCRSCIHRVAPTDGEPNPSCDEGHKQDAYMGVSNPDNRECSADTYERDDSIVDAVATAANNTDNNNPTPRPKRQCLDCVYHVAQVEGEKEKLCERDMQQDESICSFRRGVLGWANHCGSYTELGDLLKG